MKPEDRRAAIPGKWALLPILGIFILSALGLTASPAFAGTAEEISALPTLDALNRYESPLSNSGKWSALPWASGTATGQDATSGWGPADAFATVNGAYWQPSTFSDKTGDAASLTMQTSPGNVERYLALWLDIGSTGQGAARNGYQLRWTYVSSNTYSVTLAKWSAGTQTVLASNASVSIPVGTTLAISDTGGTVTAWKGSGGSLASLLSASDSAYSSGYAGIEGSGNISRSTNFKAANLAVPPPDTSISSGPSGVTVPKVPFSFTASEGGASFECSLDGGTYSGCTSPKVYEGLAEGSHTFRVRAKGVGGTDASPAERGFQVVGAAKVATKTPLLDDFGRNEIPLANGKWSKSSWAAEIGGVWSGSYHGFGSSGGLAGAYWNQAQFSDGGGSTLVSAVVGTGAASAGQYISLWLNMPNPATVRTGYEARFTGVNGSASNYTVELSKWSSGTRTVLVSKTGFSLPVGTTMALSETAGGGLVLWTGTSTLSPALTASDSTYTSGYAGIDVNGGEGTAYNFRAGSLDVQPPDTTLQSGPSGTVLPSEVSFTFTSSESGSTFECSLDFAAFSACTSPKAYTAPWSGSNFFMVRAVDAAANQDQSPAQREFAVAKPPTVTTEAATAVKATEATLHARVDPEGVSTTYQFEYGTTTAYGSKVPATAKSVGSGSEAVEVSEAPTGLAVGTTYHYRIVATSGAGTSQGADQTFTTVAAPTATTEAPTGVKANHGTLHASVNPQRGATTYQFEYGTTTAYGSKIPATVEAIGSGSSAVAVSETPFGLSEVTTYHYRVAATNEVGTTYGADKTFTTLRMPTAVTETATNVNANEAILHGTVGRNGYETSYQFEYGTTTAYGSKAPPAFEIARPGAETSEPEEALSHLTPETTYHYRLVATSEGGTVAGADKTFTTSASSVSPQQEAEEVDEEAAFTSKFTGALPSNFVNLMWAGDPGPAMTPYYMEVIRRSGANMLRVGIGPNPAGVIEWEVFNAMFEHAANRGVTLLPVVGGGPWPERGSSAWTNKLTGIREIVDRYGPGGSFWNGKPNQLPPSYWEFGNEENIGRNSRNEHVDPIEFSENLHDGAEVMREAADAPIHIILGGLLSTAPRGKGSEDHMTPSEFLKAMGNHAQGDYMAVGLHPYAFAVENSAGNKVAPHTPAQVTELVNKVRGNISTTRDMMDTSQVGASGKDIWITEIGWPTENLWDNTHLAVEPVVQRELVEGSFEMMKSQWQHFGINKVFYYNVQDINTHPYGVDTDNWDYRSGLRGLGGGYKPAWYGFENEAGAEKWPKKSKVQKKGLVKFASHASVSSIINTYGSATSFRIKWGPTTSYGNTTAWQDGGFEEGDVERLSQITGLQPEHTYHYKIVAMNDAEEIEESEDGQFTTEPSTKTFINESPERHTETLNGNPGYVTVKGEVWASEALVNNAHVNLEFFKLENGNYAHQNTVEVPVQNGIYEKRWWGVGTGKWEVLARFPSQGGLGESTSGFQKFEIHDGYQFVNRATGKCLDIKFEEPNNETPAWLWDCHNPTTNGQTFSLVPVETNGFSDHFQIIARNSDKCVDVHNDSQNAGEQLQQWACPNPPPSVQIWKRFGSENNGWGFEIQHSHQCMDDWESGSGNGNKVDQWICNGTAAQGWNLKSVDAPKVTTHVNLNQPGVLHGEPGLVTFGGQLDLSGYPTQGATVNVNLDKKIGGQWQYQEAESNELHLEVNSSGHYEIDTYGVGVGEWRARAVFQGNSTLGESASAASGNDAEYVHFTVHRGYHLVNQTSGKCLSTNEGKPDNGTIIIQWDCSGNPQPGDGQLITWYPTSRYPYYQIRFNEPNPPGKKNSGECLTVPAESFTEGVQLIEWDCLGEYAGNNGQLWKGDGGEFIHFSVLHSGQCIDDWTSGLGNGNKIDQWPCNGTGAQGWRFLPVG